MGRKKKGDMSPKKIRISFTVSPELIIQIEKVAKKHGRSLSSAVEEAIENFLILVKRQEKSAIEPKRSLLRRSNVESAPTHEV